MRASQAVFEFMQRRLRHDGDLEAAMRDGPAGTVSRMFMRAMDTGSVSGDPDWRNGVADIIAAVSARSLVGQASRGVGFRPAQPTLRFLRETLAPQASWVGEFATIPVTESSLERVAVSPRKIATIVPFTRELLDATGEIFASELQAGITRAIGDAESETFINPGAAPDSDSPGSVLYGINETPAAGDAAGDVAALVDALLAAGGDVQTAVLCCSPRAAVKLASVFPAEQVGVNGGAVAGIPICVSQVCDDWGSSDGSIFALVDTRGVLLHDAGLELFTAEHANVTFADSSASTVSLFQIGMVAIRATRRLSWEVAREGSAAWMRASWAR